MRHALIGSIAGFAILCCGLNAASNDASDPDNQKTAVEAPFRLFNGYIIVVKGSLGHLDNLNFLIDTGAVPSVISSRAARKLKLGNGVPVRLSTFTRESTVRVVTVPTLSLGPIQVQSHPLVVNDLDFIERGIGVRVDAMIGMDVLTWCNFAIDYASKRLIFRGGRPAGAAEIPLEIGPRCILLRATVGDQRLRLMVDTGAKDLMIFEQAFRRRFPTVRAEGRRQLANLGGQSVLTKVRIPTLRLAETEFQDLDALLIPAGAEAVPDFDGMIGFSAIKLAGVYFDFDRMVLSYVRSGK